MNQDYTIVRDEQYGFRRLEPLPTAEAMERFFRDQYYGLIQQGGRAPDLKRILEGGEEARAELDWMAQTHWRDILDTLDEHLASGMERTLLDFGCGPGHFAAHALANGWQVTGIEVSLDAAAIARERGLTVYHTIEEYKQQETHRFKVITLLNVIAHVLNPVAFLTELLTLLDDDGLLVIRTANDFSPLQISAQQVLNVEPWWVAIPDHPYYYDFASLERLLNGVGLKVVDKLADFPMEMFLLMGDNYVGNPEQGKICHEKRRRFELTTPVEVRRSLYRAYAASGIGRNALLLAQPT
jgi:SAM-dependent methyltransferase